MKTFAPGHFPSFASLTGISPYTLGEVSLPKNILPKLSGSNIQKPIRAPFGLLDKPRSVSRMSLAGNFIERDFPLQPEMICANFCDRDDSSAGSKYASPQFVYRLAGRDYEMLPPVDPLLQEKSQVLDHIKALRKVWEIERMAIAMVDYILGLEPGTVTQVRKDCRNKKGSIHSKAIKDYAAKVGFYYEGSPEAIANPELKNSPYPIIVNQRTSYTELKGEILTTKEELLTAFKIRFQEEGFSEKDCRKLLGWGYSEIIEILSTDLKLNVELRKKLIRRLGLKISFPDQPLLETCKQIKEQIKILRQEWKVKIDELVNILGLEKGALKDISRDNSIHNDRMQEIAGKIGFYYARDIEHLVNEKGIRILIPQPLDRCTMKIIMRRASLLGMTAQTLCDKLKEVSDDPRVQTLQGDVVSRMFSGCRPLAHMQHVDIVNGRGDGEFGHKIISDTTNPLRESISGIELETFRETLEIIAEALRVPFLSPEYMRHREFKYKARFTNIRSPIANIFKARRRRVLWSYEEVAKVAGEGITAEFVKQIERGYFVESNVKNLNRVLRVFNMFAARARSH